MIDLLLQRIFISLEGEICKFCSFFKATISLALEFVCIGFCCRFSLILYSQPLVQYSLGTSLYYISLSQYNTKITVSHLSSTVWAHRCTISTDTDREIQMTIQRSQSLVQYSLGRTFICNQIPTICFFSKTQDLLSDLNLVSYLGVFVFKLSQGDSVMAHFPFASSVEK